VLLGKNYQLVLGKTYLNELPWVAIDKFSINDTVMPLEKYRYFIDI